MLGNIEEAIMANYKKAIENGNYEQAKKATTLATKLRELVEFQGFEDTKRLPDEPRVRSLNIFKPISYSYNKANGTVIIYGQLVKLTSVENIFFSLLTQYESTFEEIRTINKHLIKSYVWPSKKVTDNAVRILVQRIRKKIELNPHSPEILINFNKKGYVFFGKLL